MLAKDRSRLIQQIGLLSKHSPLANLTSTGSAVDKTHPKRFATDKDIKYKLAPVSSSTALRTVRTGISNAKGVLHKPKELENC